MAFANGAGLASAATDSEARKIVGTGKLDGRSSKPLSPQMQAIRAELIGSDTCNASGITTRSHAPVLALCRSLIAAGLSPDQALVVYRRGVVAFRVRSIGEGAKLTVREDRHGIEFAPHRTAFSRDGIGPRTAIEGPPYIGAAEA